MKVAAYQAPLLRSGSLEAVDLIRTRVEWCESHGVVILCCPEAILGGLADYAADPREFAIDARGDQLARVLAPLASDTVTTIVGFTEVTGTGRLYNSAAVFHKGSVIGLYRKLHPSINRSIYDAGDQMPVFQVGGLTFGIVICNDANYPELAMFMVSKGATALFIPTNNGLPPEKADVAAHARSVDIALAKENNIWVIRADVSGRTNGMVSYGSSGIIDPYGNILQSAHQLTEELIVADVEVSVPEPTAMR
ncbi:MAG: carbon-nitrogen hydrolase family protein [Acidobacteria bacterium]|nr:carbon-nitrogen hydrolase family protein [Acidobacteriota bacterium]